MNEFFNTLLNADQYEQFFSQWGWLVIVALIWSLIWKGLGMWHSAKNGQRGWFILFLLVHSVGLLEIIYMLGFRPKTQTL